MRAFALIFCLNWAAAVQNGRHAGVWQNARLPAVASPPFAKNTILAGKMQLGRRRPPPNKNPWRRCAKLFSRRAIHATILLERVLDYNFYFILGGSLQWLIS
jgi:hypothetical protein